MKRCAVFVDAGYLFAQGAKAAYDKALQRRQLAFNPLAFRALLDKRLIGATSSELLRIYWYDGARDGASNPSQQEIAESDDFKLRLGFINSEGQQKGVDSLIVTDLVELARNGSISDAILISGDEDIRIGIQIAQSFGVRVHLVGIHPARGSQSRTLRWEADTKFEWSASDARSFLRLAGHASASTGPPLPRLVETSDSGATMSLETIVDDWIKQHITPAIARLVFEDMKTKPGIPPEYDKHLLGSAKAAMGELDSETRKRLRQLAVKKLETFGA
jgi:uncharacterized LabA/DUF88 family protein